MTDSDHDPKGVLLHYLRGAREAILWKLDGLSDYDIRRPMTPTGTNLLGLVKHLAYVEAGYFGATFGRPFPEPLPAWEDEDSNADLWAGAEESREAVVGLYRRAAAHADATIEALPLDTVGHVDWWGPGGSDADLHTILVHVVAETDRHAGHADILRELIDGAAGLRGSNANLPDLDVAGWSEHVARVQAAAEAFTGG